MCTELEGCGLPWAKRASKILSKATIIIAMLMLIALSKLPIEHLSYVVIAAAPSFMVRLATWVGYAAGVITLLHLPSQVSRWRAVRRMYGRIPWSLVRQIRVYSLKNRMLRIQSTLLRLMFLVLVVPVIVNLIGAHALGVLRPFDDVARSLRIPALLIFFWQSERVVAYLVPPTGLLLGTAKSVNIHLVAILNDQLQPYRVVSLLDLGKEHIFPPFLSAVMFNNLRTADGHEWRTVVHHLMDVAPLIILDTAVRTEYVDAEMRRIEEFDCQYKVISFSTAAYGKEINALESGISSVVDAARKLSEELVPQISARLKSPLDIARRWRAQQNYNAMLQSVPRRFRFNSDINGMLMKAHFILAWTMENFLRDCKQIAPGEQPACLFEDIPSRVTPAEEGAYLRQSRGLDEVRGIAFSALDLASETPGPQQSFNIANAHNKIGKCARFSREWTTALHHLGEAINSFTQMSKRADMPNEKRSQIKRELADAHFLRGEVHMARYRQTASTPDRNAAEADFRASLSLDEELGQDSSETANRIRNLYLAGDGRTPGESGGSRS